MFIININSVNSASAMLNSCLSIPGRGRSLSSISFGPRWDISSQTFQGDRTESVLQTTSQVVLMNASVLRPLLSWKSVGKEPENEHIRACVYGAQNQVKRIV
jgi:hypothetical protein